MDSHAKRKVLYVITKSNYGGAQRYVFDLATHLPAAEYEVAVACGGTGARQATLGTLVSKLEGMGIRTIPIRHFMRDMHLIEDVRAFFELIRIIRTERPDILHVTSSKAGGLGACAGRILGVPRIIFTSHGLTFDETWRPWWQRIAIGVGMWITFALAHKSIMISSETYTRARALPGMRTKIILIYNGITPPHLLLRDEARAVLQKKTTRPFTTLCIGSIAELHPNKNIPLILEALHILKKRGIKTHFISMGTGDAYETLLTQTRTYDLEDEVHFLGYVADAATYLAACDVFVLPSEKEGLPYVLLEAGYAARPVVASDIPGIRDVLISGISGTLVPKHADALADALARYLTDPSLREQHGNALRTRVHELFSIHKMLTETTNLYTCSKPGTS